MSIDEQSKALHTTLQFLFPTPGEIAELRILSRERKGGVSGYYRTDVAGLEKMAGDAIVADTDDLGNCYFGLNPRSAGLLSLADHTIGAVRGGDEETVTRRQWFLVDADPVRSGTCMATDEERAVALEALKKVLRFLRGKGWPMPAMIAGSGNGTHALWRIDLPEADDIIGRTLKAIAKECDTERVKIDTRLGDSPRICRLYGCWNRKGKEAPGRPWRRSFAKITNPKASIVSRALLEAVAGSGKASAATATVVATTTDEAVAQAASWLDKQKPAVEGENGSGRLFAVCCGLIRDWGLSREQAEKLIVDRFNPRCDPEWSDKEITHKLADAEKKAAADPDKIGWRLKKEDKEPRYADCDLLLEIIKDMHLWRDAKNTAYASFTTDGITENYPITSKYFGLKLGALFFQTTGRIAKKQAIADTTDAAEGLAIHANGGEFATFTRVGEHAGRIYLDLGNKKWEAIEIDANGWRLVANSPVKFLRPNGLLPLPMPERGGSIEELYRFIPIHRELDKEGKPVGSPPAAFKLLVSFLVSALRPTGPYPILILTGLQGGGKSTITRCLRALIDPNDVALRVMARTEQDFAIEGQTNAVLAFDNLSSVPVWLSDALCRLSTGGGFTTRELYTNTDQSIMKFCRPVILNGITDLATRGDLVERSMLVELGGITKRKDEATFWAEFNAAVPRILGALLDGVVAGLANFPTVTLDELPRMADFARWAMAAAPAFGWTAQEFLADYTASATDGNVNALEHYPWVPYLQKFIADKRKWKGTATELYGHLDKLSMSGTEKRGKAWPGSAAYLSDSMFRLQKALAAAGILFDRGRENGKGRARYITLEQVATEPMLEEADDGLYGRLLSLSEDFAVRRKGR